MRNISISHHYYQKLIVVVDSFDLYSADDLTYLIDNGDVHISEDDGEVFLVNSPVNLYK